MFDQTIRRLLTMFPRGATDNQLVWRLASSGIRISASEMLSGLNNLAERGEIIRDAYGRWKAIETVVQPKAVTGARREGSLARQGHSLDVLYAVSGICSARSASEPVALSVNEEAALPEWAALASYYAATQRKDPRGRIQEFADRHGSAWQLIRTIGAWWADASIRIAMDDLPELFREALVRRKTTSAAIGWPISIFQTNEGTSIFPGLIVPAEFVVKGGELVLETEVSEPIVNPAWLREVRRHAAWTEADLLDRLFPEGEETDLGAVSGRMRYLLATIGGGSLRPADLASELSQAGKGLRNAAALFLPEDASFTRGTAEDLEIMRMWSADARKGTALAALLASVSEEPFSNDVPVLPSGNQDLLTDSQLDAARAALAGPLTVIQGPPGTGKSEVILSLILSAVLAGRSVLFAAKNHQAIDEVERRLSAIVPDAPILTRGRDADGERDASFLDALSELAKGETRPTDASAAEHAQNAILEQAKRIESRRASAQELDSLHLALSELASRLAVTEDPAASDRHSHFFDWLHRLQSLFYRLVGKQPQLTTSLSEEATTHQIRFRIADLRERIAILQPAAKTGETNEADSYPSLAREIASNLPKLADFITRPDEPGWRHLVERAREVEFSKTKSAKQMLAEDARAILRHRPVWAVSTLSVPSRIPLVAGLFDYVIFDEASQCDIASSLPLFARARKAVVVGDPMQLRFVPQLGNASEHALMDAAGLPKKGRAVIAQSTNSLFDFCETRVGAARKFLADQFRSAPSIVDYLNADFYDGRLIARRDASCFRPPNGYRPGLAWEDVTGTATRENGGTINDAEAKYVALLVRRLAADSDFSGSVGVISPFNAQVAEIQKRIEDALPLPQRERLSLRVATVDKFQGGEADVILFSLVLSASGPRSAWTFLQKERRRLNVAISRARALCIVVGDLSYARGCGIRHVEFLAKRATTPWTPHRPQEFDSDWERRLDAAMRRRGLLPFSQFPVGTRYLDFALDPHGAKLNVEVDGRRWHTDATGNRKVADRLRDAELRSRGWKVLRFWVHELAYNMEECLDRIEFELSGR